MRLDELIPRELAAAPPLPTAEITALCCDSRAVAPGALFLCVPGFERDGHDFAGQAVRGGAAALLVERPLHSGVPEVLVRSVRAAMGPVAARFYGDPSRALDVVGITGTNGKTTTAFLVRALLEAVGVRCGLLGTVKSVIGGRERPVARTTPEAPDLQGDLRAMLDAGDRACAMEVSSHALALGRTDAVRFAVAVFTNLTQDHLDFHVDMEDYFQAKRRLFTGGPAPGRCVINIDDPHGRRLAEELPGALTFSADGDPRAGYSAGEVRCDFDGCRFRLRAPEGERAVHLPMAGRFNVANALAALAAVQALGHPLDPLLAALQEGVRVPGRFEAVDRGQSFAVVVDYAHTPDSIENVLRAARELAGATPNGGRVVCVFGAGGDRDRGKRPQMGEIAARLSEVVVITSDNPRSEDPERIVEEVLVGARRASRPVGALPLERVVDRRAAIEQALSLAHRGDVVVIAGKGHEQGQELAGGVKVPFDDVAVARELLGAR